MCELLRDNLYELYKYISRSDWTLTLTLALTLALSLSSVQAAGLRGRWAEESRDAQLARDRGEM